MTLKGGMFGELVRRFSRKGAKIDATRGPYTGNGEVLLSHLHGPQLRVAHDPSKRKCVTCSRRAGKTVLDAALLGRVAENYANALCIYITITRKSAKRLMWPELKRLNRAHSLGWRFNEVESYVTTPSGSVIVVAGADKREEVEKFRGLAPSIVIIDECASFKAHIEEMIEEVIEPGLMDYDGELILTGTPGKIPAGYFWRASADPKSKEWSRHSWTILDNPQFPAWAGLSDWKLQAKVFLAGVLQRKGWAWDNPKFQREYLGLWCRDDSSLLYRYDPIKNHANELPEGYEWRYVMGIDLGASGTAFVIWAYSPTRNDAWVVWAEKHTAMLLSDIVKRGQELEQQFRPMMGRVIDEGGLGKMINAFLNRQGFACAMAEKSNKMAFIEALNDDLVAGLVHILAVARPLIEEWIRLERSADGGEVPGSENHCADAALYGWRRCRHYLPVQAQDPKPGDQGYDDYLEEQLWSATHGKDEIEKLFEHAYREGVEDGNGDSEISRIMSPDWGAAY